jgi:hypothetical protein
MELVTGVAALVAVAVGAAVAVLVAVCEDFDDPILVPPCFKKFLAWEDEV